MKMGLPKDVVKHAMVRDGLDPNVLDMDPKSVSSLDSEARALIEMIKFGL